MFELRLEERSIRVGCEGRRSTEKVLQFRTKDVHVDGSTTTNSSLTWSEWCDVPVVQQVKTRRIRG